MKRKHYFPAAFSCLCSGKKIIRLLFSFACVMAVTSALVFSCCKEIPGRIVRVGIYDNPPKVEIVSNNNPRGIFIDIIGNIAQQEGWDIRYIQGNWDEGLTRLENNSIDLMLDVAFSEERNLKYDFNKLTVLCSWLQVFSSKNIVIESVSSLREKTVLVLKNSIQQQVCENIRDQFNLSFNLVVLPDYDAIISYMESGMGDAAIVSRFYGYRRERKLSMIPTPVILHPTTLHFATAKGRNLDLLSVIDKHIAGMMNDSHSEYYRSLDYWLSEKPRMFVPGFVIWSIVLCVSAFLFFFILSLIFRWKVRKRTEELREKNNELISAMQELKTAQDEAIKCERLYTLGQLASGVAHDFNNLLIPIICYTDLLLMEQDEPENNKNIRLHLDAIRSAARHGVELIKRMQEFYRSTKNPETRDMLDTNAIIREVIELARIRWIDRAVSGKTGIEIVLNLGENTRIRGSKSDIHEMLLNLVLNAADAMFEASCPEGNLLEISTENINESVIITVKDNGIGMTDEIRRKCLQPFFTTKGEKGTGMGLTMVNNIVTEYGIVMDIESAAGKGTSFILTFPQPTHEL